MTKTLDFIFDFGSPNTYLPKPLPRGAFGVPTFFVWRVW